MEELLQVLSASVASYNLPLTILLVGVLGYWLMVGIGFLDFHSHLHIDAGDLHVDGADAHIDGHVDHAGGDGDLDHSHGGALHALMSVINSGHVPVMVVGSFLVVLMWAMAILGNYYFNPHGSWLLAGGLLVPNVICSLLLTRLLVMPLKPVFAALQKDYDQATPIVGQICQVTTGEVTHSFGQAVIETKGAPITINIRLSSGQTLRRGDQALVVEEDRDKQLYKVVKYEQPKLEI